MSVQITNPHWSSAEHLEEQNEFPVEELPEIVLEKRTLTSKKQKEGLFDSTFDHLSNFKRIENVAATVQEALKRILKIKKFQLSPMEILIKDAQTLEFSDIISALQKGDSIPEDHPLEDLAPILHNGILRVGGRLDRAKLPFDRKHPYLIPRCHPISRAILSYFHIKSGHQGRHITHGLIRQGGYHLENGKLLIKQFLNECIVCNLFIAKSTRIPCAEFDGL